MQVSTNITLFLIADAADDKNVIGVDNKKFGTLQATRQTF